MVPGSPRGPYLDTGRPAKGAIDLGGETLEPPRIGRGRPGSPRGARMRRTGLRAARSAVPAKAGTETGACVREFLNICSRAPRFQLNKASAAAPSSSVPSHQDPRTCPRPKWRG